jgi:hypothetical protein
VLPITLSDLGSGAASFGLGSWTEPWGLYSIYEVPLDERHEQSSVEGGLPLKRERVRHAFSCTSNVLWSGLASVAVSDLHKKAMLTPHHARTSGAFCILVLKHRSSEVEHEDLIV